MRGGVTPVGARGGVGRGGGGGGSYAPSNAAFYIQPSPLVVKPELPVLATNGLIAHFQNIVYDITDDADKYSAVEVSEAYERLGITQFYYGSYRLAISNLTKAWDGRKRLPFARSNIRIVVSLALAYYRIGELDKAEKMLTLVPQQAIKAGITDLAVAAYANLSIVCLANSKPKEALDHAKRGLELAVLQQKAPPTTLATISASTTISDASATRFAAEVPPAHPIVLDLVRIMLTILIKTHEFTKAENLLFDYTFPEPERQLLQIGLNFANGKMKEVQKLLLGAQALGSVDYGPRVPPAALPVLIGNGDARDSVVKEYYITTVSSKHISNIQIEQQQQSCANPRDASVLLGGAHISFNQAVSSARVCDFAQTKLLLESTLECIDKYIEAADIDGKYDGDVLDSFINAEVNIAPQVRSYEQSLRPLVILSHVLAVRGEVELLNAPLSTGTAIQVGSLLAGIALASKEPNVTSSATLSIAKENSVSESIKSIKSVPAPVRFSGVNKQPGEENDVDNKINFASYLDQLRLPAGAVALRDTHCAIDKAKSLLTESSHMLIKSHFARRNDRETKTLAVTGGEEEGVAEEDDDKEVDGRNEDEDAALATIGLYDTLAASNRSTSYSVLLHAIDHVNSYKPLAKQARIKLKKLYGVQLNERGTKGAIGGQSAKAADLTSKVYCPTKHDALTLSAELLPLLAHSGRNEIALWLQWAVASTGGFGYGSMGSPFSFLKSTKKDEDKKSLSSSTGGPLATPLQMSSNDYTNKTSEAFLKEVKSRIYEVETIMGNKFDGAESLYKPGEKESRILLNAVLAKICFQLNLRRDCELVIETIEILTADMKNFTQNSDHVYIALARRFRFDLEELKIPGGSSAEGHAAKLQALLLHAKSYYSAAEKTGDVQLQRDALKKLMNIYSDFSNISYPESAPAGYNVAQGESYPPPVGNKEMLMAFTATEISEKEKSDPIWLRQFGRIRALETLEKYQACGRVMGYV